VKKSAADLQTTKAFARLLADKSDGAKTCRELYEVLIADLRPQGTLAHSMVYEIARIMCTLNDLHTVREAVITAAMTDVVERCLKDMPAKSPEEHVKYALVDAKKDAIVWKRNKARRKTINARLRRAGYDLPWIQAQAYDIAGDSLERLDRTIAFQEERRRRLLNQLQPIESLSQIDVRPARLINGPKGTA
jgi:hypothetical protein